jgi:hypothetical protein
MVAIAGMQSRLQSLAATFPSAAPSKRQAILVLGMHRSGTSAVGGVLSALGAGAPRTLAAPDHWNARGYFESARFFSALDKVLASAGSHWDDWRSFDPRWVHSAAAKLHSRNIAALLLEEYGDEALIFIKDPRICRLVPFTSMVLAEIDIDPVAIIPVRNPLEVGYSLERRDKFALSKSMLLWLRHVLDAEFYSRHMPRHFLPYDDFLVDWRWHVDRFAEKTGVTWPARSGDTDVKVDRFLTPDLRHKTVTPDELKYHPEVGRLVRQTYSILTDIVAGGESRELRDRLDQVRTMFNEGCEMFGAAVADLAPAHNRLVAERDALAAAQGALMAELDALAGKHDRLVAERDALKVANDRLEAARDALLASRSWRMTAPLRYLRGRLAR